MELDDLKALWKETDRRLQAMEPALRVSLSLNLRQAKAGALDRMRSKLRWVRLVLWYEVAFAALVLLLLGSYLFEHWDTLRFALPAAALHLGAIATLGVAVRQLMALGQIDHAGAGGRHAAAARRARRRPRPVQPLAAALDAAAVGAAGGGRTARPGRLRRLSRVRPGLGRRQLRLRCRGSRGGGVGRPSRPAARSSPFFRALGDDLTGRRVADASGLLDDVAAFESEA